jgi:hypothetical protein
MVKKDIAKPNFCSMLNACADWERQLGGKTSIGPPSEYCGRNCGSTGKGCAIMCNRSRGMYRGKICKGFKGKKNGFTDDE